MMIVFDILILWFYVVELDYSLKLFIEFFI